MEQKYVEYIAKKLQLSISQVSNTIELLNGGATVPFIARYRKEATESLDEVAIGSIRDGAEKMIELIKRKETVLNTIEEQDKLTSELIDRIDNCFLLNELEDIYLPYKPKRRTRAAIAREKGLEPLAKILMKQLETNPEARAVRFLNQDVESVGDALSGARDVIAEWINENQTARNVVRSIFEREAKIRSKVVKGKEEEGAKFRDYFNWQELQCRCPSHRMLAIRRGEREGILRVSLVPEEERVLERLNRIFVKTDSASGKQVELALKDSYKRLLGPAIETEFFALTKEKADEEAIKVFADNLRQLLLSPPLGPKRVLAIDPGYRTGCKLVCLDEKGDLLHNENIYPHPPQKEEKQAMRKISALISSYQIEAVAIGNGTASRETESLIKRMRFDRDVQVFVVSEDGASVYSASKVAREEFPKYDVTVRGAISIGRRLTDPLAELVKIEPKAIGVGQYQHDVDQKLLQKSLDGVVASCVNLVGVNLNTASKHLLTYVSGLGSQLAQNIVDFRSENGPFDSRFALKKVPRLGEKTFQQCAGFLRIPGSKNPLDNSAVHPESYKIVERMASNLKCSISDLIINEAIRKKINPDDYVSGDIGLPTLEDILHELAKPGRDPREKVKLFEFADGIVSIEDLHEGMILPGIVTNITRFGAFVDIGIKQDGLVHISELANAYISDPNEVVRLNQQVKVKVLEIDKSRNRISFSMKRVDE